VDLTHLRCYTIDDAATTEVDDGISIEPEAGGGATVYVHVADPTRYTPAGCALDKEARRRTRTLYLPFGSAPAFPPVLAAGPFSLRPGEDCCALTVVARVDADGALLSARVMPSTVRVSHKLSYIEADALLAAAAAGGGGGGGPADADAARDLHDLSALATARHWWRRARGAIDIDLPEAEMEVGEEQLDAASPVVTITRLSQFDSPSRQLVAEAMVLAGQAVGTLGAPRRCTARTPTAAAAAACFRRRRCSPAASAEPQTLSSPRLSPNDNT
jgi:exoribonuclease-2